MSKELSQLEPKQIWKNFSKLNAIPRGSKKEDRVVAFIVEFGKSLGLETRVDAVKNVLIKKPATPKMMNCKTVVLQSHLDMVHQKNNATVFDFDKQGIDMFVDGDWVKARGTTLGADNGLGVAAIMSILESKELEHPAIEALFTIDEETGMSGAKGLQAGFLSGNILLNLDTEEDDEIDIGCAGGLDVTASKSYAEKDVPKDAMAYQITLKGLRGGHSGMDIHMGFGNANKMMNEILLQGKNLISVASIHGGSLRNAIPRESVAVIVFDKKHEAQIKKIFEEVSKSIKTKFKNIEPGMDLHFEPVKNPAKAMETGAQKQLLEAIENAHNGVYKMSEDMQDLVEASNNIAKVNVQDGSILIECLTRSSVEKTKAEVAEQLKTTFDGKGFKTVFSGDYPGWKPNPESPILAVLTELYTTVFNSKPKVVACHAGLECGILGTNYPGMDMISFGPTIHGAHSPDEKANIASAQKFWKFLLAILQHIPLK